MMQVNGFFDENTATITYVVFDETTRDAVVIDPVWDYEPLSSRLWCESVERVTRFLEDKQLTPHYLLETHAHADHLSGAQLLKRRFPATLVAVSRRIVAVQSLFREVFDLPAEFATDGSQFDRLVADDEVFRAGALEVRAIPTPGHTPACTTFAIGDAVFTGDALFMPDVGTGRCDFPGGSAADLYRSITERLYTLPDDTRVFVGHDYPPAGRSAHWQSTVGEQKRTNVQLAAGTSREQFLTFRTNRDTSLSAPRLLYQSVQVNVAAGHLPPPGRNGKHYLKIPVNATAES